MQIKTGIKEHRRGEGCLVGEVVSNLSYPKMSLSGFLIGISGRKDMQMKWRLDQRHRTKKMSGAYRDLSGSI